MSHICTHSARAHIMSAVCMAPLSTECLRSQKLTLIKRFLLLGKLCTCSRYVFILIPCHYMQYRKCSKNIKRTEMSEIKIA